MTVGDSISIEMPISDSSIATRELLGDIFNKRLTNLHHIEAPVPITYAEVESADIDGSGEPLMCAARISS